MGSRDDLKPKSRTVRTWVGLFIVATILAGLGWHFARRPGSPPGELRWVDDVVHHGPPGTLKVKGALVAGSLKTREDPCTSTFILEHAGVWLDVRAEECALPSTFGQSGYTIVVEGKLTAQASFDATRVLIVSNQGE